MGVNIFCLEYRPIYRLWLIHTVDIDCVNVTVSTEGGSYEPCVYYGVTEDLEHIIYKIMYIFLCFLQPYKIAKKCIQDLLLHFTLIHQTHFRGCDRMVVGFTTIYAVSAYHH
jgi:hypothetical protein